LDTFVWPIILILNAALIILLALFLIWKVQKDKRSGYPMKDERTSKIQGKAALGTYYITLSFMISILIFSIVGSEFFGLPDLEAGWTVIAIMLVSGISFGLLSWYYAKKGEL
jgi:UDP-N-acetylmuramyl pentapeptide phosphotransferase/UDP-N-acetylglucosamine-1-phosphate transferase